MSKTDLYPKLEVKHITDPSRFYAVFIVGAFVKGIMLIPVIIEAIFLGIYMLIMMFINSIVVFTTEKYWDPAYNITLGVMRFTTKVHLFVSGLTNKYPGFDLKINDPLFSLDMAKPAKPNRWFALPLLGGIARGFLLIPYVIYSGVLQYASGTGTFFSCFPVLFNGRYPESTYEMSRDYLRISLASSAFITGLSDSYPSFWISMNHKNIKIALLIAGTILFLTNSMSQNNGSKNLEHKTNSANYSTERSVFY